MTAGCVPLCTDVSAHCLWEIEIHAETSVQLGSDILVLLKCLKGKMGSMTFFTAFCDIKSWNSTRNLFLLQVFWKREYQIDNRVVILRTVDLIVWKRRFHFGIKKYEYNSYLVNPMSTKSIKQKISTEGCSKFKSPETRQVQERLVSTLEHTQVPKRVRTRCPEE